MRRVAVMEKSTSSPSPFLPRAVLAICVALAALSCADDGTVPHRPTGVPAGPSAADGLPSLPRLTRSQYAHAIRDLLGSSIVVPSALEPDVLLDGSLALGAAQSSLSRRGVEQYERAAYAIASQAMEPGPARDLLVPCTPAAAVDFACAETTLAPLARRAWRRELTEIERQELVFVAMYGARVLGDFYDGLEYGLAFILQAPDFLYRPALGDDEGTGALDGYELAARTSFFLWDTIPDAALLDAAASGVLLTDEGLAAEVERMLMDPRAEDGLRAFVTDWLALGQLSDLSKDPMVFLAAGPELGPAMREETLRFVVHHVRDLDAPYPDLFRSRETFVDRRLAALYEVPAPAMEGFGPVTLPEDGERRGLLGQASILSIWAHPTSSSPTLRGRFVRETLLCQAVPPPPVAVDTAIPEPSPEARTLRERLTAHRESPVCASCHALLDPIGLGLERFDGLGHFRRLEAGGVIDPSGELDGVAFADAAELADAIAEHPSLPGCFARRVLRYATGRVEDDERDLGTVRALDAAFWESGYRVDALLRAVVLSPAFRNAQPEGT